MLQEFFFGIFHINDSFFDFDFIEKKEVELLNIITVIILISKSIGFAYE